MSDKLYDIVDYLEREKASQIIIDAFAKTQAIYNQYGPCNVSISGGADSDIMLDMCTRLDVEHNMFNYYFFNTGLEYEATRRHIVELEAKYGVTIEQIRPELSCRVVCEKYGMPFLSKQVSDYIARLQKHDFSFTNNSVDLDKLKKCERDWWMRVPKDRSRPMFITVYRFKYLKEFLMEYKPQIKISSECCDYLKKKPGKAIYKQNKRVVFVGVRRAEGGARAKNTRCFTNSGHGRQVIFRPVFWFTEKEKRQYNELFGITNSDCYTKYGLTRTGCVGCPFNPKANSELEQIKAFEPGMYKAAHALFQESYDYMRQYRNFVVDYEKMEAFRYLIRHPLLRN